MKILSRFIDYYDYVAKQYGGGDPRVVYNRSPFGEIEKGIGVKNVKVNISEELYRATYQHTILNNSSDYTYALLIIAGKAYPLFKDTSSYALTPYKFLDKETLENILEKHYYFSRKVLMEYYTNLQKSTDKFIYISRQIKQPVFIIERFEYSGKFNVNIVIQGVVPILQNYGLQKIVPAEIMYQDIAYFVGNVIHENPDITPPVQINDKDRYEQKGFDSVTSFRHRK